MNELRKDALADALAVDIMGGGGDSLAAAVDALLAEAWDEGFEHARESAWHVSADNPYPAVVGVHTTHHKDTP